jgi:fatty acid desaturase
MISQDKINNDEYFNYLRARPLVAWPTVIQMIVSLTIIAGVWYAVTTDMLPLWAGAIINIIAYYFLFSPIHDGTHHALSHNKKVNDFIASFAYLPVSFLMPAGSWARLFHMQHHRHTGKEILDPDLEISSKGSHALWKWFIWGFHYRPYYKQYKDKLPTVKVAPWNKTRVTISLIFFAMLVYNFPLEFLFLWVVPLYAGVSWMTAFVFSYLPHHIHKRVEGEDPLDDYQATCNITGYEWILSPLMQYQNYHMVHHLYPTVPFYRMHKIWNAHLDEHISHNPSEIKLGN